MKEKVVRKKAYVNTFDCVSCGVCVKTCPLNVIHIHKGMYAVVNLDKCVGCKKCEKACPASVIEMK